ncbi:hypothetical protein A5742_17685 [Mycolicibacterium fortuitum]|uniref:SEFIR domain-containing protein n=1 Tax=Mycolicibacterium fortuitum TaxID=1766 RepID=A0ABD6QT36_MYCFO|nr:hypothetical protein A5742_17685 [Mycolicibacterium fortuitum]
MSWAHSNPNWNQDQSAAWQEQVKEFADLLRAQGIEADLDLFHLSETSIDWTRWGPGKVRTSDFVIVAMSEAWAQRWLGQNAPTVGAGAVAEADMLKGIFGRDQSEFQRKTLIALLPGVRSDVVPEDLYRLNRFRVAELTREGVEDLLRTVFEAPRHVAAPVGPRPTFDSAAPSAPPAAATGPAAATAFDAIDSPEYFHRLLAMSEERIRHRRRGAGLTETQVASSLAFGPRVPHELQVLDRGLLRILHGPLGSGKSEVAEQWHRESIERAAEDPEAAVPVWIAIDELATGLEAHVLAEVGLPVLGERGVDVVVDGLDERADRAAAVMRQAGEFVKKWPQSRLLLTTRSPGLVDDELLVAVPLLPPGQASALMTRVAERDVSGLGAQLESAVERPLFALLVAQHMAADGGATGIHEVIARVADDVVSREGYNLFAELRALAVATIRAGGAVDPATITSADVAARIRRSPLVVTAGRRCAFALATFEQWFAAQAVLDGVIGVDEFVASIDSFGRWRYVLAIVAATADPVRADAVLAAVVRWNPGAAGWLVDEMSAGGLSRALPEDDAGGGGLVLGQRFRSAMHAWLDGLGPLADCFGPSRMFGVGFDDIAVAVTLDSRRAYVSWFPRFQVPGAPLPEVVENSASGWLSRGPTVQLMVPAPTAVNGVWQLSRNLLISDLTEHFPRRAAEIALAHNGVASEEARIYQAAARAHAEAPPGFTGNLDVERLYPAADIAPSQSHPFGGYTTAAMHRYAVTVIDAAMRCYLEISAWVTPNFDRSLPLRGMMPVEFFGTMFYESDRGLFDYPGLETAGFSWMFRPIGTGTSGEVDPDANRISLTINDNARSDEMTSEKTRLYTAFTDYIESHPEYEPFARPFTSTHGRIGLFHRTPATQIALGWLWHDMKALGFVTGPTPPDF